MYPMKAGGTERERLKPLCSVFGPVKVNRITVEMVRTYMADRDAANAANKTINLELGVLRGVMKRAKLWHHFSDESKRSSETALTTHLGSEVSTRIRKWTFIFWGSIAG